MKIRTMILYVLVLCFTTSQPTFAQSNTFDFYYHSKDQQAIIFEDVIGNTQTVEITNADYIYGPGFSSSYNWFAYATGERTLDNLVVFSINNDVRINIRDQLELGEGVFDLISWANSQDILVFNFTPNLSLTSSIYVLSLETGDYQVVVSSADIVQQIEWLQDDSGIMIHSGTAIELYNIITNNFIHLESAPGNPSLFPCETAQMPQILSDGTINFVTSDSNHMRIYNFVSDFNIVDISLPSSISLEWIFWSKDYEFALLYFANSENNELWLYSKELNEFRYVDVASKIRLSSFCSEPFNYSIWGNHYVIIPTIDHNLFVLDADTHELVSVNPMVDGMWDSISPVFWSDDETLAFAWFNTTMGDSIYTYDVKSDTYDNVVPINPVDPIDTQYFAVNNSNLYAYTDDDLIIESVSGTTTVSVDYSADGVYGIQEFLWHPDENWLFAFSPFAGANNLKRITFVDVSNNISRLITDCPITERSCFGWLP